MKKLTLIIICMVGGYSTAPAQTINDYISEARGDTLVVKTYTEMGFVEDALPDLVALDSLAPDGRVYELKQDGLYPVTYQIAVTGGRPLVIEGEDDTPHVSSTSETIPPNIYGMDGANPNILWNTDITLRNLIASPHNTDGIKGWFFSNADATGLTYTLDNVYMEHTYWVLVHSVGYPDNSIHIKNSYFVNLNGNGCRRNGGVYDNINHNTKEIWVENSTHVMGAGMTYKFRNFPIGKVVFNHNTFVNISNAPFSSMGYQTNMIVANNLFVNTNVQAYYPGLDITESDQDKLPNGIINIDSLTSTNGHTVDVNNLPDAFQNADPSEWAGMRKVLVDGNAAYWSPVFDDAFIDEIETMHADYLDNVEDGPADGKLMHARMTMNYRTQAMFDNNAEWPYLTEGTWYNNGDPGFTDDFGLLDNSAGTPFADFLEYTKKSLDDGNAYTLASIRTEGNSAEELENFAFPDWPIPVDLSYSNPVYFTGGYNGFPVGDLNWFPAQKAQWDAQREVEYAALETALNAGEPMDLTTIAEEDSLALVHLYNSTNGDDWSNNENWLDGPVSSWYGVEVTNYKITEINLTNNNLVGELPDSLSELKYLTQLILSENPELAGVLTESFIELGSLNQMYLDGTGLIISLTTGMQGWIENLSSFKSSGKVDLPSVDLLTPDNNENEQAIPAILIWNELPDADRYLIELYKDEALEDTVDIIESTSGNWISIENLEYNTSYYWRVSAGITYGFGEWSELYSFKTQLDAGVSPALLFPEINEDSVAIPVTFSWAEVAGAQNYYLEVSFSPLFDTTETVQTIDSTQFVLESAVDETSYFWRVRAVAGDTPGGWSTVGTFTTEFRVPETPSWDPESDGAKDVPVKTVLVWNKANRAETYNFQLAKTSDFEYPVINETGLDSTKFAVNLVEETTYYWRIQAVNRSGASDWSQVASFTTVITTSSETDQAIPQVFALQQNYPNPFNPSTVISYQLPENSLVSLEIFDMVGRKVATLVRGRKAAGKYTATFDASRLSSGLYIYRLRAGDFMETKKMMLIK